MLLARAINAKPWSVAADASPWRPVMSRPSASSSFRYQSFQRPLLPGGEGEDLLPFLSGCRLVAREERGPASVLRHRASSHTAQGQSVEGPGADHGSALTFQSIQQLPFASLVPKEVERLQQPLVGCQPRSGSLERLPPFRGRSRIGEHHACMRQLGQRFCGNRWYCLRGEARFGDRLAGDGSRCRR